MLRDDRSLKQMPKLLAGVAAVLTMLTAGQALVTAQTSALQDRLTEAKAVSCSFTLVTTATWTKGVASAATTPIKYNVGFKNIKVDEGSADAESQFGDSFIVVRQAGDYLHLIQSYRSGPLYTTTVFARESTAGRFIAVHTRHEYTDVSLPGITSRPEMYVGDCAVTP